MFTVWIWGSKVLNVMFCTIMCWKFKVRWRRRRLWPWTCLGPWRNIADQIDVTGSVLSKGELSVSTFTWVGGGIPPSVVTWIVIDLNEGGNSRWEYKMQLAVSRIVESTETLSLLCLKYLQRTVGCITICGPVRCQVTAVTLSIMALNICGSSEWKLLQVTPLRRRILSWLLVL